VIYERPVEGPVVDFPLALFRHEMAMPPLVRTPGIGFEARLSNKAVAELIPGGVPGSPWPLVLALTVGALLVGLLGAVLLFRLRSVVALREQFVSSVSHELRTPLAKILSYGETLQLERPTPVARAKAAGTIVREARKLTHLVENTLDFARLERAGPGLDPERLDLSALVVDASGQAAAMFDRDRDLRVSALDGVEVSADRHAFGRVVRNLVENALTHTVPGTPVEVEVRVGPEEAVLVVEDGGEGIPEPERDRIWMPFERGSGRAGATGTGLGLAIVRQLVEVHGGTVEVDGSERLGGARFTVVLPRAEEEA
jgi:signal transduction histidine kinase